MTDQIVVQEEQDQYDIKTDHGYFIISRAFIGSSTWKMGGTVRDVAIYLIGKAAHSRWKYFCPFQKKEIWVERGEVLMAQTRMWSEIPGITFKQFRGAFGKLEKSGLFENITPKCVKGASSYTHIRLRKYESYQNPENYKGQLKGSLRAVEGQRNNKIKKNNKNEEIYTPPTPQGDLDAPCHEIIDHLNETAGKHFKTTDSTKRLICARIKEGATVDNFKYVHENKTRQWKNTDSEKFLRPETLYTARHFESYLNEPAIRNGDSNPYRTGQEGTWVKGDDAF